MNPVSAFLSGVAITACVTLLVAKYLRGPLKNILADLCGTTDRAELWLAFTNVPIVCIPLIVALRYRPTAGSVAGFLIDLNDQIQGTLLALIFTVVVLAIVLIRHIPRAARASSETVAKP